MDGDYRNSDGGPWAECARCGATLRYDPDAWDDEGVLHDQFCESCADEMDEGEE